MYPTPRKLFSNCLKIILIIFIAALTIPVALPQGSARVVRVVGASAAPGGSVNVPIELVSQGDENALGFSLTFSAALLSNPQAALGSGVTGATLNVNPNQASQGRLGVALALPSGQTFTAGTRQIVVVTFSVASTASGSTTIDFGDQPIAREVVDVKANTLVATYTSGQITFASSTLACEVLQLWPVDGAGPGKTAQLWAKVQNNDNTLPSNTIVRFYVDGPNFADHWVGSTSVSGLAPGTNQWYSFAWAIPSSTTPGNYTYWAQVWTTVVISGWSPAMQFKIGSGPPGKATLVSPNGTITTTTPTYKWNAVATATYYELWMNDSTTNSGKITKWYSSSEAGCGSGTGTCSVTPSATLALGAAQWWILTWNEAGYGPWSDGMPFTVVSASPPGKATLISPSGTISTTTPTYTWSAVTGADWYMLLVIDLSRMEKVDKWYTSEEAGCASGIGTCSAKPDSVPLSGLTLWWILTYNSAGPGPWSDVMSFTVIGIR